MADNQSKATYPQQNQARPRWLRIFLPVFLLVFAFAWYLFSQITWVEYQADLGITEKARNNAFLAATIFLREQGIEVRSERSLRAFDQALDHGDTAIGDTIVLLDAYGSLSSQRMQNLLSWVHQGGHLIASASNHFIDNIDGVTDSLFEHFNVVVDRQNGEGMEQELWEIVNRFGYLAGMTGAELCPMLNAQTHFSFSGGDADIGVHFLSTDLLLAKGRQPDAWVGQASSAYLLQYDLGEGMVTLVTSLDLWNNSAVGCLDHAWFLWQLAPEDGVITWYSNFEFPGVMSIVWRHFDLTIVTALSLLMLWLWYRGVRFGPIRERSVLQRRQLLEHIDASAHFSWRIGKIDHLINTIRELTLQQLRHKHRQLFAVEHGKSDSEQSAGQANSIPGESAQMKRTLAAKLFPVLELPAEQIHLGLWQPIADDPQQITEILAVLQKIKEKL